jgi:hypothetical protein
MPGQVVALDDHDLLVVSGQHARAEQAGQAATEYDGPSSQVSAVMGCGSGRMPGFGAGRIDLAGAAVGVGVHRKKLLKQEAEAFPPVCSVSLKNWL